MDEDERLARQLQQEEFDAQRREEEARRAADEEFARRLCGSDSGSGVTRVTSGQTVAVRLQHPSSGNQIDDAVYAHYIDRSVMMFEMVRMRGSYMRIRNTGEVGE